ncbi:MAG: hypothetical protein Q7R96_06400 [Nanoarchaeota archaeon]|nr:hypothetical protein [Nanoarchaeota archaeon]
MHFGKRGYVIPGYYYAGIFLVLALVGLSPFNATEDTLTGYAARQSNHEKICSALEKKQTNFIRQIDSIIKNYDLTNTEGKAAKLVTKLSAGGQCYAADLAAQQTTLENQVKNTQGSAKKTAQRALAAFKKTVNNCKKTVTACTKLEYSYTRDSQRIQALEQQLEKVTTKMDIEECGVGKGMQRPAPDTIFCPRPGDITNTCTVTGDNGLTSCQLSTLTSDGTLRLDFTNDGSVTSHTPRTNVIVQSHTFEGLSTECLPPGPWSSAQTIACTVTGLPQGTAGSTFNGQLELDYSIIDATEIPQRIFTTVTIRKNYQ